MGKQFRTGSAIYYMLLFSSLGLFSFLLLVNYTDISHMTGEASNSIGIFVVYLLSFNIAGFMVMRLSSWINNQYSQNIKNRWRILGLYTSVILMLLLLNYGLLVIVKIVANTQNPLYFQGNGFNIFIVVWFIELIIIGLTLTNHSILNTLKYQKQVAEFKEESDKARYVALQNQLNPHFLFNTLNTLIAEIEYDPKNAVIFTKNLADVYRYVLQFQEKPLVSLGEELEFIRSYLFLHKVRIGGYIDYHHTVPNEYLDSMLPPLTLQLLVENIIKHNSITQKRNVDINICVEDNFVIVSNTINLKKNIASNGIGLKNLSNRCQLILGRDIAILCDNKIFTVKIPLLYEKD